METQSFSHWGLFLVKETPKVTLQKTAYKGSKICIQEMMRVLHPISYVKAGEL